MTKARGIKLVHLNVIFSIIFLSFGSRANLVGTDAQNFNPTSNGVDFVTVQSGRTLDPGVVNFGFFLNYAANTLSFLENADPSAVQNRTRLNDKLLSADLSFGLGLTKNIDIGITLPFLLSQDIQNDDQVAYFSSTGNTEQRVNVKYKFHETDTRANALVLTANNNNIDDNPYTGTNPGLTKSLEWASSWKWSDSWFALNLGHRWRDPGTSLVSVFGIDPIPNMYIYSVAWSRMLKQTETKVIFEIFGGTPSEDNQDVNLSNRNLSNLEALAGLKHSYSQNLSLHAGAGTELFQGFGSPDWRVYAGLNWNFGPIWKKSIAAESKRKKEKIQNPQIQRFILTNLKFKFDSDELESDSFEDINQIIQIIKDSQAVEKVLVEGHTDSMGAESYNLNLSTRRALAIKNLISKGVPVDLSKMESAGFGESQPMADNSNYQGRAKNRRVVVSVFSRKSLENADSLIEIRLSE